MKSSGVSRMVAAPRTSPGAFKVSRATVDTVRKKVTVYKAKESLRGNLRMSLIVFIVARPKCGSQLSATMATANPVTSVRKLARDADAT